MLIKLFLKLAYMTLFFTLARILTAFFLILSSLTNSLLKHTSHKKIRMRGVGRIRR